MPVWIHANSWCFTMRLAPEKRGAYAEQPRSLIAGTQQPHALRSDQGDSSVTNGGSALEPRVRYTRGQGKHTLTPLAPDILQQQRPNRFRVAQGRTCSRQSCQPRGGPASAAPVCTRAAAAVVGTGRPQGLADSCCLISTELNVPRTGPHKPGQMAGLGDRCGKNVCYYHGH